MEVEESGYDCGYLEKTQSDQDQSALVGGYAVISRVTFDLFESLPDRLKACVSRHKENLESAIESHQSMLWKHVEHVISSAAPVRLVEPLIDADPELIAQRLELNDLIRRKKDLDKTTTIARNRIEKYKRHYETNIEEIETIEGKIRQYRSEARDLLTDMTRDEKQKDMANESRRRKLRDRAVEVNFESMTMAQVREVEREILKVDVKIKERRRLLAKNYYS